jgi:spermidine synthase
MDRWFEETFHRDWRVRLTADRVLEETKSAHQDLVVFENATWGRVLLLDGVIQLTTSDEFVYHEMMAHVPLMALQRPRHVLVIGGGDGGVMREILRHPSVLHATLVDIDRSVIELSQRHFPEIAAGAFDDPRCEVLIADGAAYVASTDARYDAIIVDSSEPVGASAILHSPAFFANCKRCLRSGGLLITQNGMPNLAPQHLTSTSAAFARLFADTAPYMCWQPCYFGGAFAINWGSDDPGLRKTLLRTLARRQASRGITTRYYTPQIHQAAFALPAFVQDIVLAAHQAARAEIAL